MLPTTYYSRTATHLSLHQAGNECQVWCNLDPLGDHDDGGGGGCRLSSCWWIVLNGSASQWNVSRFRGQSSMEILLEYCAVTSCQGWRWRRLMIDWNASCSSFPIRIARAACWQFHLLAADSVDWTVELVEEKRIRISFEEQPTAKVELNDGTVAQSVVVQVESDDEEEEPLLA